MTVPFKWNIIIRYVLSFSRCSVGRKRRQKNVARKAHFTAQHALRLNIEIDQITSKVVNVCIKRHSQFLNLLYIPLSQSFYITAPRCGGLLHVHYCHSFENTPYDSAIKWPRTSYIQSGRKHVCFLIFSKLLKILKTDIFMISCTTSQWKSTHPTYFYLQSQPFPHSS